MKKQEVYRDAMLGLISEMFLDHSLKSFKLEKLYRQIDEALERGDEETFLRLTEQLRELKEIECL